MTAALAATSQSVLDGALTELTIRDTGLCDLPSHCVDTIVAFIDEDDALAVAMACRALRDGVLLRWQSSAEHARLRSRLRGAVVSVARIRWAHLQAGVPINEDTCEAAAAAGRQDVIVYLRSVGCPWDEGTCAAAMEEGHVALLRWLRKSGCPYDALGWGRT